MAAAGCLTRVGACCFLALPPLALAPLAFGPALLPVGALSLSCPEAASPVSPELAAAVLGSAADGFSEAAVAVVAAAADGCC